MLETIFHTGFHDCLKTETLNKVKSMRVEIMSVLLPNISRLELRARHTVNINKVNTAGGWMNGWVDENYKHRMLLVLLGYAVFNDCQTW